MRKDELIRILNEIGVVEYAVMKNDDMTIKDMIQLGYSESGARRAFDRLIRDGKLVKLKAKIGGNPINIYRKTPK